MSERWHVNAVLLDMDGALLDTEKVYFNSLVAALDAAGYAGASVALCHAMVGLPGLARCLTLSLRGAKATKQSIAPRVEAWIASLRSQ